MRASKLSLMGIAGVMAIGYATPKAIASSGQASLSSTIPVVQTIQTPSRIPPTAIALQVGFLREIEGDTTCGRGTGGTMTYAETRSYRIYICADRNNPTKPRFYRSRNRNGRGGLNLEAVDYDPQQYRYFEFKNRGYTYTLQIPTSQSPNPVLEIEFPNGRRTNERVTRYLAR